jgi:hypothetical protein
VHPFDGFYDFVFWRSSNVEQAILMAEEIVMPFSAAFSAEAHRWMNRLVARLVSALKEELNILIYQMVWYS